MTATDSAPPAHLRLSSSEWPTLHNDRAPGQ